MAIKAELVFIPMPRMGHFLSMVQVAKFLVDLNPHLSITFLVLKLIPDAKLDAYLHSLTSTATTGIKFIDLPQPETDKHLTPADHIRVLVQKHGPLVKEAVTTSIVQYSGSVPDSPRLAGFVLDMFLTPFIDLGNEFGVPSYVFYTSGAAFLGFQFYTLALHDEQNVNIVRELRKANDVSHCFAQI
ncbi:Detected protein of confused Function [Hibiscus syriacus]|uniref:Detected protein of confused Function n=1 Tax=Hibiscus syriacus TaxID=106335 RepID=A0A6A3CKM9_HIBSY|nr:Detected protein of confused Function [Hibiscus syriacus]